MRNSLILLVFVLLCVMTSGLFAQSATRTVVTLGGTWWNAAYSYEDEDGETIQEIGAGNSFGPYISINHGKINFGASLLFGTFPIEEINDIELDDPIDMSRSDLNFTFGYRVHPNINVFLGAKYLNWKLETDYDYYDSNYGTSITITEESNEGGMLYGVGISGVIPLGSQGLYAFGSIAAMGGSFTYEHTTDYEDYYTEDSYEYDLTAALTAINVGMGYRFPSGWGVNAGYRADLFGEESDDFESDLRIRVQGLLMTASYSF